MDYAVMLLRALLGTILAWLPVSPEIVPNLSGYLCPIYVGAAFAGVFYFRREIGLIPRDFITQSTDEWPRVFLYSLLFTFVIGYPIGKRVGTLTASQLIIVDIVLGIGLLIPAALTNVSLRLPEDTKAFVLSTSMGIAQGLSSPGIARGAPSLLAALVVEKNVERAVRASLLASSGYFALRAILMGGPGVGSIDAILTSTVSFLLSLLVLEVILRSSRYGRKFVIAYALLSFIALLWR
ncbi:hypothetical protein A3L09_08880 [Thermococcus profundus]|uniref:Undecaprenyl-diphosphatase n=1 Tax=Thermococcus profundus TaxID=49899 RepID=A0A2Z2MF48_THEPR|nr:undecaprenyl-diphosphate phosphatase [Thermococcus profundus]ASJ03362.1 hypothetical protein A3L09_08880 [Thermococcus profundus]